MRHFLSAGIGAILFLSCNAADAADIGRGARLFQQHCALCHSAVRAGPENFGPTLFDVVGRKPGTVPGFAYSSAIKAVDIPWSPARLEGYIAAPAAIIPGVRMRYVGPADRDARSDLVGYLATLR